MLKNINLKKILIKFILLILIILIYKTLYIHICGFIIMIYAIINDIDIYTLTSTMNDSKIAAIGIFFIFAVYCTILIIELIKGIYGEIKNEIQRLCDTKILRRRKH